MTTPASPACAFGEKVAGLFWKQLDTPVDVTSKWHLSYPGGMDPKKFPNFPTAYVNTSVQRRMAPRALTRLFDNPAADYRDLSAALDYHRVFDPIARTEIAGQVLRNYRPKVYKHTNNLANYMVPRDASKVSPTPDVFEHANIEVIDAPKKKKKKKPAEKKATFWQDYAHHFNNMYNPESYGFDIRTPTGRDDLRNIAVATGVGTLLGAGRGAIWPGYIEKFDDQGHVISKKKRGRLAGSLRDALMTGSTSALSSAAGITAKKYLPEIESALGTAKEKIVHLLPIFNKHQMPAAGA